jgi:hypothetical protein
LKCVEEGIEPIFRVSIINSEVTVECDVDSYNLHLGDLYKRASDLAKASANMAAFATGYGLVVVIEALLRRHQWFLIPSAIRRIAAARADGLGFGLWHFQFHRET